MRGILGISWILVLLHLKIEKVVSTLKILTIFFIILYSKENNNFRYRPCGAGIQDFPSILASAESAGTEYLIVEQDVSDDIPPMEAVKISRDYFKSLGI